MYSHTTYTYSRVQIGIHVMQVLDLAYASMIYNSKVNTIHEEIQPSVPSNFYKFWI